MSAIYSLGPAALGLNVAALLTIRARSDLAREQGPGPDPQRFLLFLAIPTSGFLLAALAAFLASQSTDPPALAMPLLVVGAAALAQGIAQGLVARACLPRVEADAGQLGRAILFMAAPEVLTIGAFAWFITASAALASAA